MELNAWTIVLNEQSAVLNNFLGQSRGKLLFLIYFIERWQSIEHTIERNIVFGGRPSESSRFRFSHVRIELVTIYTGSGFIFRSVCRRRRFSNHFCLCFRRSKINVSDVSDIGRVYTSLRFRRQVSVSFDGVFFFPRVFCLYLSFMLIVARRCRSSCMKSYSILVCKLNKKKNGSNTVGI